MGRSGLEAPLIEAGAEFRGLVRFHGALRIDGCVRGSVRGTGCLQLSETASVIGDVEVHSLDLEGSIEGHVSISEGAHLGASAFLSGSLRAGSLHLEEGAQLCAHPLRIRVDRG